MVQFASSRAVRKISVNCRSGQPSGRPSGRPSALPPSKPDNTLCQEWAGGMIYIQRVQEEIFAIFGAEISPYCATPRYASGWPSSVLIGNLNIMPSLFVLCPDSPSSVSGRAVILRPRCPDALPPFVSAVLSVRTPFHLS